MTKFLSFGTIIFTLLFLSCSEKNKEVLDESYNCISLPYFEDTSTRATQKSLKGNFLFSWENDENGWNYSIVPNLNSTSAFENVSVNNSFSGEECLQNNLSLFAEGEEIWWVGEGIVETTEGKKLNLSFPPEAIIKDIEGLSKQLKIELVQE